MNQAQQPAKRSRIDPVSILVRTQSQVEVAINKARNLPIDPENPIEIIFQEAAKKRTIPQNSYYHMRIGEIASQAWFNGRQFDHDTWHGYMGRHVMPERVTLKNGDVVSKWIEAPDGTLDVISTTKLEKKFFAKYTTMVEAFGASLGVHFSAGRDE